MKGKEEKKIVVTKFVVVGGQQGRSGPKSRVHPIAMGIRFKEGAVVCVAFIVMRLPPALLP